MIIGSLILLFHLHLHFHLAGLTFYQLWHPLVGNGYQFWSGLGSDLGEVTLILGLGAVCKHQFGCDAPRCLRPGPHKTADGHHKLCRKHHPDLPEHKLSLKEIHIRHHKKRQEITGQDDYPPHN